MARSLIIGICLSIAVTAGATAKARRPTPGLTGERLYIARVIERESERDDRLTPARLANAIMAVEIDHDGVPDYLVDYNKITNTHWCGDGGCDFELWHGVKGGHPVRVWKHIVREYRVAHRNGEVVFDFDFHGSNCGTFGVSACPASFAWDREVARMVERPTRRGETIVRLIDPIPVKRAQVPDTILAASRAAHAKCQAYGTNDDESLPASIPDIDGDGLRDWSLTIAVCRKPANSVLQQMLFATAGDVRHPTLAASGAFYSVSIRTKPAAVARVNPTNDCGGFSVEPATHVCTQTPLTWHAAAKRLETASRRQ